MTWVDWVVVGFAGLLDLGYVAFFAIGAYSFAIFSGAAHFNIETFAHQTQHFPLPTWHMYTWLFFFVACRGGGRWSVDHRKR